MAGTCLAHVHRTLTSLYVVLRDGSWLEDELRWSIFDDLAKSMKTLTSWLAGVDVFILPSWDPWDLHLFFWFGGVPKPECADSRLVVVKAESETVLVLFHAGSNRFAYLWNNTWRQQRSSRNGSHQRNKCPWKVHGFLNQISDFRHFSGIVT